MVWSVGLAALGVTNGFRHALEPDHLAAVATIASEQRSPLAAAAVGAWWGVGHAASLVVLAGSLAAAGRLVPEAWSAGAEALVGLMLIGLGARALIEAVRADGPVRTHRHGGADHAHPTSGSHLHLRGWTFAVRPLLVGLMHGVAGSGALTALLIAEVPVPSQRIGLALAFGCGTVFGMVAATGLMGAPMARLAARPGMFRVVHGASGALSAGIGVLWSLAALSA